MKTAVKAEDGTVAVRRLPNETEWAFGQRYSRIGDPVGPVFVDDDVVVVRPHPAAPQMPIPRIEMPHRKPCGDGQAKCVVCGQPVTLKDHPYFIWEHKGGGTVVTLEEGERLNAAGEEGASLGGQPVGKTCLKKHPELKPYLLPADEVL